MKQRALVYTPAAPRDLEALYDLIADASSAFIAFGYKQRLRAFCDGIWHPSATTAGMTSAPAFASSVSSAA